MKKSTGWIAVSLGLLMMGTAAHAGSSKERAIEISFPAGSCAEWQAVAAGLEQPQLAHLATVDGFLRFSAGKLGVVQTCGETCTVTVILGFLVPPGSEVGDLTIRFADGKPTATWIEAGLLNHQTGLFEPIFFQTADVFGVAASGLPIGDPAYLHCGWIQLRIEYQDLPPGPTGASPKDVVTLPDVILDPT